AGQSVLDVPAREIEPARIVRNRGALQSYRPLEIPKIVDHFIRTATSEVGVLRFVEKFGPLTSEGLRGKGDVVPEIVDQAKAMLRPGATSLNKLNASIVIDHEEMRLKVWPACLLDALWLQLVKDNARTAECPQCHEPFRIGVGRRKDARFCSEDCRIKFNSLERSR